MPQLILASITLGLYTELFGLYTQVAMKDKLVMQWCVKMMSH